MEVKGDQVAPNHYLRFGLAPRMYRFGVLGIMACLGIAAVVMDTSSVHAAVTGRNTVQDVSFALVFTIIVVLAGYQVAYRMVYFVEVRAGHLSWRTPVRKGTIPIGSVRAVCSGKNLARGWLWISTDHGRLWLGPGIHYLWFAERLTSLYPTIRLEVDGATRSILEAQRPFTRILPWASRTVREGTD
jgi:hypothetical protein